MKYLVKYTQTSHSRYGNYVYKNLDKVEADSKEQAINKVKETCKENHGHWKFRLVSAEQIAE